MTGVLLSLCRERREQTKRKVGTCRVPYLKMSMTGFRCKSLIVNKELENHPSSRVGLKSLRNRVHVSYKN